jgi:hypothetical protein
MYNIIIIDENYNKNILRLQSGRLDITTFLRIVFIFHNCNHKYHESWKIMIMF